MCSKRTINKTTNKDLKLVNNKYLENRNCLTKGSAVPK